MGKKGACAAPVESSKDAFLASFLVGTGHMEHPFLRLCRFSIPFASGEEEAPISPGLVSVKFSSVIHLTVDNYYLRGFGFISISV